MQTGYYAAAGGMVAQFNRLDTIANNLANVNTAGFKKESLITGDFARLYKQAREELPVQNNTSEAASYINRAMTKVPHVVDAYTDHSLGSLQKTDNTLDVALSREGLFFAVETPDGIRLTRDGSFSLNEDGVLVTKHGYTVLSSDYQNSDAEIQFNTEDSLIELDKNGQFYNSVPGSAQLIQGSKLLVVQPENINYLKKEGDGLYIPDSADALENIAETGAVLQGFIEKSNVNPMNEMIAMIEANRLVGMYQKAMDTQMNDMNRDAIEKLASTRQ
ncbi:MAG: flagellar hook-basal body protein [Campylobacterota bacterium]|nr:flagellar hook-basal body protein [Campylobacterota bacterium]